MRPQSLLKQVDRREKEYQDDIMASLAHELGVTSVFPVPVQQEDININQADKVRNALQAKLPAGVCFNLTCGTSSEPRRSLSKARPLQVRITIEVRLWGAKDSQSYEHA